MIRWALNPVTDGLVDTDLETYRNTWTYRNTHMCTVYGYVKMTAEIGIMLPQAKQCLGSPEAGKLKMYVVIPIVTTENLM